MALRTVKIEINAAGNGLKPIARFYVNPYRANEKLCFTCDDGEFAVLFDNDRSPYASGKKAHAAQKGGTTLKLRVRPLTRSEMTQVFGDPVRGATFKYGVAVLHPRTGVVLTLDSEIIIDDPGGG